MKIFEERATYRLSVILEDDEHDKYLQAFRSQKPIQVPEFENKMFQVEEISGYYFAGAPEKSYSLTIKQVWLPGDSADRQNLLKSWGVSFHS